MMPLQDEAWWIIDKRNLAIIGKLFRKSVTDAQFRYTKLEIEKNDNISLTPFYANTLINNKMINKINRLSKNGRN